MKVNSNRDISFKSVYTNKALKKGLEFASDNGALFAASACVGFSMLRPLSIWITPNADKENRKLACAKSITSSILNFGIMLGLSLPLSEAMKKIDNLPEKYLNKESVNFYSNNLENLYKSKRYIFGTQIFKLGLASSVAIPKAILTASAIPYIMQIFGDKSKEVESSGDIVAKSSSVPAFKAKQTEKLAGFVGKILDKESMKNFVEKYKDSNFVMHIMAITDTLSTLTFINRTKHSNKIKEERKKALMYNAGFSTALCIGSGYAVDKALDKPVDKFITKFKQINAGDKNVDKQVQGIKIAKPVLILGIIYYMLIPFISTYLAEIVDKNADLRLNKIDK